MRKALFISGALLGIFAASASFAANEKTISGDMDCGSGANFTCGIDSSLGYVSFSGGKIMEKVLKACKSGDKCEIVGNVDANDNLISVKSVKKLPQ